MKKTAINKKISQIIKSYSVNTKLDNIDSDFFFSLFKTTEKLNYIEKNHYFLYVANYKISGGRYVKMLFASDGHRKIPISKSKLLNELFPKKSKLTIEESHINNVKIAARNVINPQIKEYRENISLPIICPLSLKKINNWKFIHIDHVIPFSKLFNDWLDSLGISPLDIELCGPKNFKTFKDIYLKNSWYEFHKRHADLQCVNAKHNILKSNKYEE